jgi:hypothetical protein
MVYPASDALRAALTADHEMDVEVWLLRDPPVLLPISGGSVTATYRQQVSRNAALTLNTRTVDELAVSNLSDVVLIRTGIPNVDMVPIFVGRIDNIDDDETGSVSAQCVDRGADVIRARFETPWPTTSGQRVSMEIQSLILSVDGTFSLTVESDVPDYRVPVMIFEEDRGAALDELAASLNSIWTANRYGGFTLHRNPYSFNGPITSVATISDGVNGTIVTYARSVSREQVANSVTVIVERSDGSTPLRVTVRDTDTGSPTYWGGPFGKQNIVVRNTAPLSETDALALARRILNQHLAVTRQWRISTPHFPILDPGDVITVNKGGYITQQVVESITYPLLAVNGTAIGTRELRSMSDADAAA